MNFKRVSILAFLMLFLMAFNLPKNLLKKVHKEIKQVYEVETYEFNNVEIPSEIVETLTADFSNNNLYKIETENGVLGYAYIAKAPSKTAEFDYLVLLDKDLIVKKSKVLIYREEYGGEIGSKRWLKQFIGKTKEDSLKLEENIAAISGATISVRSMTNAMNNFLQSLKVLHEKNVL